MDSRPKPFSGPMNLRGVSFYIKRLTKIFYCLLFASTFRSEHFALNNTLRKCCDIAYQGLDWKVEEVEGRVPAVAGLNLRRAGEGVSDIVTE